MPLFNWILQSRHLENMVDIVSPEVRSRMMAGIRGKDTKPELMIRKDLHALGFRYRLHDKRLPGKPDIVFTTKKAVIFVHGCFWHGHNCPLFHWPSSRKEFWETKITRNQEVDQRSHEALKATGWRQCVVWECALRGKNKHPIDNITFQCLEWLLGEEDYLELSYRK